ncbi:MAG TPA: hypothetical protein PKV21_04710 [bacterium]|nr:hypothetical protein [bacterium]HOM26790.1 hypothetical protein [bacterium]
MDVNYFWNPESKEIYFDQYDWSSKVKDFLEMGVDKIEKISFEPIDLSKYLNINLEKGILEETKGVVLPEKISFQKIPFIIQKNSGVILRPGNEISIEIDKKCKYLYFLHLSTLPMSIDAYYSPIISLKKPKIGNYKIIYKDGTSVDIPIINRLNIIHWNSRFSPYFCRVAYQTKDIDRNLFRVFFYKFKNPYPEKKIDKIEIAYIENEEKSLPIILGLTAGL